MDSRIFKQWFFEEFVPVVEAFLENKKLPRKALLILDNASSHPDADELVSDGIRALFLPPNVTALIQPLDQGVLETFKRNYKKRLLRNLLEKLEDGLGVTDALKLITMKDVVYWVSEAWDNVREDTIRRSWRKLFGIEKASRQETAAPENQPRACPPENEELVNLCNHLPVAEPISAEDISEWINGDEDQALTDDVIIQMLNQPEDDDNDEPDGATEKISHTEGLRTIEGALAYIEQQETATTNDLVWLRRWRNRAASLRSSNLSQKTITDFFGKKD
ncbi:jerky protein homolog-like [Homalodisca vitripennis]|uniref:jerky protein homolog-like n=1 Tax=Homalodisca vitripennis TaxID=197043 RepID=UPI001EEB3EDC|nr:jerky protein homolog-like [Homalodisca vitripennis]XP_046659363.1 jerky protein homolog-like [Homalodisca vitripennis]XP_046670830.1 jerky protein homolog-like [Homalodisca vitripennis]XP_046684626.1 jerky protein homolog-like [Homalodisca vitripennis]XP_046686833.1 jerky protein homolog-like [Homalodisca vitripennis]